MLASVALMIATAVSNPAASLDAAPQTRLDASLRCHLGSHSLPNRRAITITGSAGEPKALQFTLSDGRFGRLNEAAPGVYTANRFRVEFAPCPEGRLRLTQNNQVESANALNLPVQETRFTSDGIELHGKLVMPINGRASAIAVWIEGSNNNPSTDDSVWQYELARRGVGVFVYDKRGTGASSGTMTSDFDIRARDTAAAVRAVRRLAPNVRRVGVVGASQGGWVAPLTATYAQIDFMVAAFAMAEGPIAQDRAVVELQLRQAGYGDAELSLARSLTTITERIVRSEFTEGFEELEQFKIAHSGAPWMAAIQPRSFTGLFVRFSSDQIRTNGRALSQGLSFGFEPRPILEGIATRQLWLLAGNDQQAPSEGTQRVLNEIQHRRRNISVVVFPRADHGLIEQVDSPEGRRSILSARQFDVAVNWIKSERMPGSGRFVIMP
jgi:uncharacterized protein